MGPALPAARPLRLFRLLATQSSTAISALDGTVIFTPASLPGVADQPLALAATGNTSTLPSPSSSIPECVVRVPALVHQ